MSRGNNAPRAGVGEPWVHPTQDDPVVAALSEGVGGPVGTHAGRHRWWTPVRVLLALTALCFALGMVQKTDCYQNSWRNDQGRYAHMCYSDLPYLYVDRGFVELTWPYTDDAQVRQRFSAMEYPVVISYVAWASAWVTHWWAGSLDVGERYTRTLADLGSDPRVIDEERRFVVVSAVLMAGAALLTTWFLSGVHRRRPWDAALFAASPTLALAGLINWDLFAVALVAGALWAWSRDRPVLTGVLVGLGVATKLYPLFLLGALTVLCLRERRVRDLALVATSGALAWAVVNLPAYLAAPEAWTFFWTFNSDRGADLGSVWLVISDATGGLDLATINSWAPLLFGLWCGGVLLLGLLAPEPPRLAQLAFLVVAGFLLVNKVYSPQYVLWLLPLAALARPRWRDHLVWQSGEVLYFAFVWWYVGGYLAPAGGGVAGFYWIAIGVRVLAELYLVAVVVRDVLRPEHDPVRMVQPGATTQTTSTRSNAVAV